MKWFAVASTAAAITAAVGRPSRRQERIDQPDAEQARECGRESGGPCIDDPAIQPADRRDRPVVPRWLLEIETAIEQHRQAPCPGVKHPLGILRGPRLVAAIEFAMPESGQEEQENECKEQRGRTSEGAMV